MPQEIPRDGGSKLIGIDLLRFFSALAILIWHYQHFSFLGLRNPGFRAESQPWFDQLTLFYRYGNWAVFVFWCISGYVFFWKYREPLRNGRIGAKSFFLLRFSRLYPLHFVTLLAAAALQLLYHRANSAYFVLEHNDPLRFLLHLGMASHWTGFQGGLSFNGPIWSVSVEVLAYILFFLILRVLGGSILINFAVIAVCLFDIITQTTGHPLSSCLALFYAGGVPAIISQAPSAKNIRVALGPLAIALVLVAPPLLHLSGIDTAPQFPFYFILLYTPVLLYVLSEFVRAPAPARKYIEAAGNMTYSSYLIHFPIQILIALVFSSFGWTIPVYNPVFFLLFLTTTFAISYFVYTYFEAPAQAWIRAKCLDPRPKRADAPIGTLNSDESR